MTTMNDTQDCEEDDHDWRFHSDSDGDGILDKVVDGKRIPFKFTISIYAGSDVVKQSAHLQIRRLYVFDKCFREGAIGAVTVHRCLAVFRGVDNECTGLGLHRR